MLRWIACLMLYLVMQVVAYVVTPLLPLFAVNRDGLQDNANANGVGPRLPLWLSWFDTPDNDLFGDPGHINKYITYPAYLRMLFWLYRNSLYGFKWSVIAFPLTGQKISRTGPLRIDYHDDLYGVQWHWSDGGAWQYKCVKPFMGKTLVLNFGWMLDDPSQKRALFMFSPRLK